MEKKCEHFANHLKSSPLTNILKIFISSWILIALIVFQLVSLNYQTRAQQLKITVSGTVKEQKGETLIGSTVRVKGTTMGALTDAEGRYILKDVPSNATLIFSFIGMTTREVPVNGRTSIDIILFTADIGLDEIVVVGYQEIKKKDATASIVSIQAKDIENNPAPSFENMLQGRLAGVNIQSMSGEPGVKNVFVIRGNTNISTNIESQLNSGGTGFSNPLYVVDGVPTTLEDLAGWDATNTNFLSSLNTNDIESIDILKDASAAAIYGSRGANGVVIIKTKKGRIGEPEFTFNSYAGFTNSPNLVPVEVGIAERRAKYDLINNYWDYNTRMNFIPQILTDSLNPEFNNNVNYQGIFYKPGLIKNYDFGVSGGTEKTNYRLSLGYYDEDGIVINTGFKRYSLTLNLGVKLSDKLENQTIIRLGYVDRQTGLGNANSRWGTFPVDPLNLNSSLLYLSDNEVNALKGKYTNLRNVNINVTTSLSNTLRFRILEGLYLNNTIGVSLNTTKKDFFAPSTLNSDNQTLADYTWTGNKSATIDTYLSYTKTIKKIHALNFLLGNSVNYNQNEYMNTGGRGAASDQVMTVTGLDRDKMWGSTDFSENGMLSYWSRAGYKLKEKYMLDLNFRMDGSSRFGANSRWGYFPSISGGWIFSQESYVKEKLKWINYGKIRASWGINGSQFSDDYLRFNSYIAGAASYLSAGNKPVTTYNGVTTVTPNLSKIANEDLSWEQSNQWSVGMDLELFGRRLYLTPEVYNRETKNLLFDVQFPIETGYSNSQANIAGVRNYGWELGMSIYTFKPGKDFQWQIDFNIANNYNQVTALPNGNRDWKKSNRNLTVGLPMNLFYVLQNSRLASGSAVYSSLSDIPVDPYTGGLLPITSNGLTRVGSYVWEDINGDNRILKDNLPGSDLRIVPGKDPNPRFTGGLIHTLKYKKWSLRIMSSYVMGRTIINNTLVSSLKRLGSTTSSLSNWANRSQAVLSELNYWRKPGDVAEYATMDPAGNNFMNYLAFQSRWLEDGSYFKVNSFTLSYTFDAKELKKISLKSLRFYAMMDNIATFSKFTGPDPERVDVTGSDMGSGYALPKKITLGINVKF